MVSYDKKYILSKSDKNCNNMWQICKIIYVAMHVSRMWNACTDKLRIHIDCYRMKNTVGKLIKVHIFWKTIYLSRWWRQNNHCVVIQISYNIIQNTIQTISSKL